MSKRLLIRPGEHPEADSLPDLEMRVMGLLEEAWNCHIEVCTVSDAPWAFITAPDEHVESVAEKLRSAGFRVDDADAPLSIPENREGGKESQ